MQQHKSRDHSFNSLPSVDYLSLTHTTEFYVLMEFLFKEVDISFYILFELSASVQIGVNIKPGIVL